MSSQPKQTNKTETSTAAPLPGAQGGLFNNLWGDTANTVATNLAMPQPEHFVAGPTAPQQQGAQEMLNVAPSLGRNAGATSDLTGKIAGGYFSNPWNDPNFQGSVNAALEPSIAALNEKILPGVRDASMRAGGVGGGPSAYGGANAGDPTSMLTENVLKDWTRNAQNTGATMAENAYKTGLGLTSEIPALATSATGQALTPSATALGAGGLQQQWAQGNLQDIIQHYMMQQQQPLATEQAGASIGATGGFGGRSSTGVETGTPPSLATQWLQGSLGGANALSSLFAGGPGGAPSPASSMWNAMSGVPAWLSGLMGAAPAAAAVV